MPANTWAVLNALTQYTSNPSPQQYAKGFIVENSIASSNPIKITFTGAPTVFDCCVILLEYSGLATSNSIDQVLATSRNNQGAGPLGSGTAIDTGAMAATSNNNDLLVSWGGSSEDGIQTFVAGAGYTIRSQFNDGGGSGDVSMYVEDQLVSTTGAYHGTATASASMAWMTAVAALKTLGGTPAVVQSKQAFIDSAAHPTSITVSFNAPTSAGHTLLALVIWDVSASGSDATIADVVAATARPIVTRVKTGPVFTPHVDTTNAGPHFEVDIDAD